MADDKERGLYNKFVVARSDGSSEPGGKHEGCRYFVVDVDHDPYAAIMLLKYAGVCREKYPALAADLTKMANEIDPT